MIISKMSDMKIVQSLKRFERIEKKIWKYILKFVDCSRKKHLKK